MPIFLPRVLACHGEVLEINHNSLCWPALTTSDCWAAAGEFISGAPGFLLRPTRWGRTWGMEVLLHAQAEPQKGVLCLIWNAFSCTTKRLVHSVLTSGERCLVSSAGSEACGFRKPGSSTLGGDLAVLQGDAEVAGGLWAILPLCAVCAGCSGLHRQPAPSHGCSSSVSTCLACSPGLEAIAWSCSLSLNHGYGLLKTDTRAQRKPSPTFANCFEIFFCTRIERL